MSDQDPVPAPSEPDDVTLMEQAREGCRASFERLVRRHQQPLVNFFRRMGVYNESEDLAQETFLRIYGARHRYQARARFTTYLYTVARRVWIDHLRKGVRREALKEQLEAEWPDRDEGGVGPLVQRLDVRAALDRLPDKLRSVVVLNMYQGLKYDEIGAVLDIPTGTVKSRMFVALGRLKDIMESHEIR